MFNIKQSPSRPATNEALSFVVFVQGSLMAINGEEFDFSFMENGSTLPKDAIDSPHFASDVVCDERGVINLTLIVPIGTNPTKEEAFPPELLVKKYGTVIEIYLPAIGDI